MTDPRPLVADFLAQKRIALVGLSHDPKHFSRVVMHELTKRGYDVVPVNPRGGEIEGWHAYARLADIEDPVQGVLIMTPASASADIVRQSADLGVQRVWLHRGAGEGAVSDEAVGVGRSRHLRLVVGECPLMHLDQTEWPHRAHRALRGRGLGLALVQLFIGLGAVPAGAMLLMDPTGAKIGFTLDMLRGGPFADYTIPGLFLLGVNGLGSLLGAALTLRRHPRSGLLALALGLLLMAWIGVQVLIIGFSSALQPALFLAGLLEAALGYQRAGQWSPSASQSSTTSAR